DAAGGPTAGVLEVRDLTVDLLAVLVPERKLRAPLADAQPYRDELVQQVPVVSHQSDTMMAERDHYCAGERGSIDDCGRIEASGVGERIGECEPSLRIGVDDLDRLAEMAADHVARLDGRSGGHVLRRRNDADDVDLELQLRDRLHRRNHRSS